jgi:hypothetical protein
MSTPADELRAAATLLRETASKATPGPWQIRDGNNVSSNVAARDEHMVIDGGGWTDGTKAVVYGAALTADAAWIALMSPAAAEPLAALLKGAADDLGGAEAYLARTAPGEVFDPFEYVDEPESVRAALAIARAVNRSKA